MSRSAPPPRSRSRPSTRRTAPSPPARDAAEQRLGQARGEQAQPPAPRKPAPPRKRSAGGKPRAPRAAPPSGRTQITVAAAALLARWQARLRLLTRIPGFVYLGVGFLLLVILLPTVNWVYQVVRKPSEMFFPISENYFKTPDETWRAYGAAFRAHSTAIMTPELLAALAQKEASGNPVARTYWRWRASRNFFEIYRPASSAVGMYQFTDGTFDEARRYCIHHHRVVADGPWHDVRSCWFNRLYARVIPSHAIELASSNLDRRVREILARHGARGATLQQQQALAVLTHLCGAGAAARFAVRGLRAGDKCGDHDAREYVLRVLGLARNFARLRARDARRQ